VEEASYSSYYGGTTVMLSSIFGFFFAERLLLLSEQLPRVIGFHTFFCSSTTSP
jgi:hypothetical protein